MDLLECVTSTIVLGIYVLAVIVALKRSAYTCTGKHVCMYSMASTEELWGYNINFKMLGNFLLRVHGRGGGPSLFFPDFVLYRI